MKCDNVSCDRPKTSMFSRVEASCQFYHRNSAMHSFVQQLLLFVIRRHMDSGRNALTSCRMAWDVVLPCKKGSGGGKRKLHLGAQLHQSSDVCRLQARLLQLVHQPHLPPKPHATFSFPDSLWHIAYSQCIFSTRGRINACMKALVL